MHKDYVLVTCLANCLNQTEHFPHRNSIDVSSNIQAETVE
jgi:hypothetical protein